MRLGPGCRSHPAIAGGADQLAIFLMEEGSIAVHYRATANDADGGPLPSPPVVEPRWLLEIGLLQDARKSRGRAKWIPDEISDDAV